MFSITITLAKCLSVRPSFTRRYCVETATRIYIVQLFSLSGKPRHSSLVLLDQTL